MAEERPELSRETLLALADHYELEAREVTHKYGLYTPPLSALASRALLERTAERYRALAAEKE